MSRFFKVLFSPFVVFAITTFVLDAVLHAAPPAEKSIKDNAYSIYQICKSEQPFRDCFKNKLEAVLKNKGTGYALDLLEQLAQLDGRILSNTHTYVHALGWSTLEHYKDLSVAFANCKSTFWSGCYHGVLQAYLGSLPKIRQKDIAELCDKVINTAASRHIKYQCLHGTGHGLALHFKLDLIKTLSFCDAMQSDWDRQSCYGGVFMENVASLHGHTHDTTPNKVNVVHHDSDHTQIDKSHGVGSDIAPQIPKGIVTGLQKEDPLYPCSALDDRYGKACYMMQTSAILAMNGHDFLGAFEVCDRVKPKFRFICHQSLGRDISGFTINSVDKVIEMCMLGNDEAIPHCYVGAVKDFMMTYTDADRGIALCKKLKNKYKKPCYIAVGQILVDLYPNLKERAAACHRSEERYIPFCKASAFLY